jgi:2,4-dienoyl-CoA reductase-like NADH-dependent reductase (Old Yellow Enzyme family)
MTNAIRAGMAICDHDRIYPYNARGLTHRNRIAMLPMYMYSAEDGFANDFHLVHLGRRATGGLDLVVVDLGTLSDQLLMRCLAGKQQFPNGLSGSM